MVSVASRSVRKENTREVEAEPVVHTGQIEDVQVFAVKDAELLQVRLHRKAEEQVMESTGCPEDDKADVDCESESDSVSVTDSVSQNVDLYSLEEIMGFWMGFPDVGKCIKLVTTLQKVVGLDLLDGKKCYHLRKVQELQFYCHLL